MNSLLVRCRQSNNGAMLYNSHRFLFLKIFQRKEVFILYVLTPRQYELSQRKLRFLIKKYAVHLNRQWHEIFTYGVPGRAGA
jgi:hypothetical protein